MAVISPNAALLLGEFFHATPEELLRCPGTTCIFHGPAMGERDQDGEVLVMTSPICSYSRFMASEHYCTMGDRWLTEPVELLAEVTTDTINAVVPLAELRTEIPTDSINAIAPLAELREEVPTDSISAIAPLAELREEVPTAMKECILCMHNKAAYKWSSCVHPHEGIELICLECRGVIWGALKHKHNIKRDMHTVQTACPICRTPGYIVRHDGTKGSQS